MGCTVAELLARISSRELAEWKAYEKVYGPIGQVRDDWHTGLIAHRIDAMFRDPKKGKQPKIQDFVPTWDSQPPTREIED